MTAYYFSQNGVNGAAPYSAANSAVLGSQNMGTASTAADCFEIRISTGVAGYTKPTKLDVVNFMELVTLWLADQDSGLDYLISATSGTEPIP